MVKSLLLGKLISLIMSSRNFTLDAFKAVILIIVLTLSLYLLLSSFGIFRDQTYKDKDLDGFISSEYGGNDCDDTKALVNPDAKDIPNDGIDQNCDKIDESLTNINPNDDYDKDGYKLSADCDDASAVTHPGAEEILDLTDNNCNEIIDEGFYQLVLYEDFTINSYDPKTIIETSKQLETSGFLDNTFLYIEASVDTPEKQLTNYDSVYIYLDNGVNGGQLLRRLSLINNKESDNRTKLLFNLNEIPLTDLPYNDSTNNFRELNFTEILNRPGTHRLGAFVATQRTGKLNKLVIGYKNGEVKSIK